jgi:hypothetical protein
MEFLIFLALLIGLGVYLGIAIDERQQARLKGQPTHSLWRHYRQWLNGKKARSEPPPEFSQTQPDNFITTPIAKPVPEPKPEPKPQPKPEPNPKPKPDPKTVPPPKRRASPAPTPLATGRLRFIYRDAEGKESTRELTNFTLKGSKFRGFCLDRNAIRTFQLDRVVTFLEGEDQLYVTEQRSPQRSEAPDPVRAGEPEITFSGFDAKTRASLEKTAKANGFVVRKSVTKNLDYFVAGQRRSGSKLEEAEDKPGCSVIDKEGFLWLIATGEVNN